MNAPLVSNPRLHGRTLSMVRTVWLILVTIAIVKFALNSILFYQTANEICTASLQDCHDRNQVTPADVASLASDGISLEQWVIYHTAYRVFDALVYCSIAFLIFARKRDDAAALMMSLFLILFGTLAGLGSYLATKFPEYAIWIRLIEYPAYVSVALFFFTFPNGRVVPRFMRLILLLWSFYFLLDILLPELAKRSILFQVLTNVAWLGMLVGGLGSQAYRYRRVSNETERRQTKWVIFAIACFVGFLLVSLVLPPLNPWFNGTALYSAQFLFLDVFSSLILVLIPISVGIAILRYRLYDIDIIIRRTLIYSILTALLALFYLGSVVVLQQILRPIIGQGSDLAVIISTLAIAALFNPLRHRVQDIIDHRFYRRKYDAQQVIARFGATVRDEVELEKLTGELLNVVSETMQPTSVSLWLKKTEDNRRRTG